MKIETVVNDTKTRIEDLSNQSQKAVKVSIDTLKQANGLVSDSFQSLIKGNTDVAKDLFASAKSGFEKARADGVKAVAASPISYLPAREKLVDALNDSRGIVIKTRDDLSKLFKDGVASINGEAGKVQKTVKKTAKQAGTTARKTTKKASTTAKKATKSTKAAASQAKETVKDAVAE